MSLRKALQYINSLPFPLTIRHYYIFDGLASKLKNEELYSAESWDVLREKHPQFSISENREEWIKASESLIKKDGQDGGLKQRAQEVARIIDMLDIEKVFSAGSGGAGLEYQIKKLKPQVQLVCSEYSPVVVSQLKKVFQEADSIVEFDIHSRDWSITLSHTTPQKQLCLLYRVDMGFTDKELHDVFINMYDSGIENILFIVCGSITLRGVFNRFYQRLMWKIKSIPFNFAGFLRTKKSFEKSWHGLYESDEHDFAGLPGFLLKKK